MGELNLRICAVLLTSALAAGCSSQRPETVYGYQATSASAHAAGTAGAGPADVDAALELRQAGKKTLAAKVLAAIALERITGRKPDPARFIGYE